MGRYISSYPYLDTVQLKILHKIARFKYVRFLYIMCLYTVDNKQIQQFDLIYEEFSDSIFKYFKIRLSNRDDAKDLTQETFLNLWNYYLKNDKNVENVKSLLFTIAHNLLVNKYERSKKTESLDQMIDDGNFDPPDNEQHISTINLAEGNILNKKIETLPPQEKEIIYLRYHQDLSIKEVAEITGKTETNISVRIHRIIEKLKKDYES